MSLQSRGMDLVEILSFLFQLSFSTLGRVSARVLLPCCCEQKLLWSFDDIHLCVCVFSGLLGGGHERLTVDLPAALTGVWTRLPEKGKWMDFQEWEKWENLISSVSD